MCSRADQVHVVPIDFEGNSGRYDHFRYLGVLYILFREATP